MTASSGDAQGAKKKPAISAAILLLVVALGAGIAAAGSHQGTEVMGLPVFALVVAWIFLVQIIAFIPAWLNQTETFFDLTGKPHVHHRSDRRRCAQWPHRRCLIAPGWCGDTVGAAARIVSLHARSPLRLR